MDLKVLCPNPDCKHHRKPFVIDALAEFVKKGGRERWKQMSEEEKAAHIKKMNKARLKRQKTTK